MTAEELSRHHPRLYHVTAAGTADKILARGLLSTTRLLDLFEVTGTARDRLERARRPTAVPLHHADHGTVNLTDQSPMTELALAGCLDGGLTPADWLALLNRRVFFWASENGATRLLGARANRSRAMEVIVVDTLTLARAHFERIELSPINSGATIRKPARRGPATFTPLAASPYATWSRQRGKRDRIVEVTVLDAVPDIARHTLDVRHLLPCRSV